MKTLQPLEQALPKMNDYQTYYFEYIQDGEVQDKGIMNKEALSKGSPEEDIEVWVLAEADVLSDEDYKLLNEINYMLYRGEDATDIPRATLGEHLSNIINKLRTHSAPQEQGVDEPQMVIHKPKEFIEALESELGAYNIDNETTELVNKHFWELVNKSQTNHLPPKDGQLREDEIDMLQKHSIGYGNGWICRMSSSGRGLRIHETSAENAMPTIREAIQQYLSEQALKDKEV